MGRKINLKPFPIIIVIQTRFFFDNESEKNIDLVIIRTNINFQQKQVTIETFFYERVSRERN